MKKILFLFCFVYSGLAIAQQKTTVSGRVEDEQGQAIEGVTVRILGRNTGINTVVGGLFTIAVKPNTPFALEFTYTGFKRKQVNFNLNPGEAENIVVILEKGNNNLDTVVVKSNKSDRVQSGLIRINAKRVLENPSPIMDISSLLKVFVDPGNELSSQLRVRGGNYDENLIYVNDFEIFRPYLIRNGQQEGLSFINPEMAGNILFYNGGFQAKYGDKMSSVLDVQYKRPKANGGSAYVSLLEQGLSLEGVSANNKVSYVMGMRNRNMRNLFGSQETKGNYVPSSSDIQAQIIYAPGKKWSYEMLANTSFTKFKLFPEESKQTTSVFSPLFSANLGLDIFFEGRELDKYSTKMIGIAATNQINKDFSLKYMLSYFKNSEAENIDISGSYIFGDRDFDKSKATFGLITNPLGAGLFQNYARNQLDVTVLNASIKGNLKKKNHFIQFGNSIEKNITKDRLNEWEYQDSVGYSLPNSPGPFSLYKSIKGGTKLDIVRLTGYVQDNMVFENVKGLTFNAGLRYNYNNLNNQLLISPRIGMSFQPQKWNKDIIFRLSAGAYNQPPFYREMRRYDGSVNTAIKAQKSAQVSGGFDLNFKAGKKPYRFNMEAYYKNMTNVVPYDIDNVRLRYFGENNAKARTYGLEARLFGELVRDAESWISIGYMNAKENLNNDFYTKYFNAANEEITSKSVDQKPVREEKTEIGWLRRPTDRRVNFGMFFSDYLSTNKNFKVYLQTLYGTNTPYNIPGSTKYRNALEIPQYIRVDIGFSAQLLSPDMAQRRSHNPFRGLQNMWLSFEVFNLVDRSNTISYALIKDFANNIFTVPNRLTPRLVNLKLVARW